MPLAHDEFIQKLLQAAQSGEDLLPVLESERSHLAACPQCRDRVARLVQETSGWPAVDFLEILSLTQDEALPEPPRYPAPDFSFSGRRVLPSADPSPLRELRFELKIPRAPSQLPALSSTPLASIGLVPREPGRIVPVTQEWALPGDRQARLALQPGLEGLATLAVDLAAPVTGAVLTLTGSRRQERADLSAQAKAVFPNLAPGDYDLALSGLPDGQSAHVRLHLEIIFYVESQSQSQDQAQGRSQAASGEEPPLG